MCVALPRLLSSTRERKLRMRPALTNFGHASSRATKRYNTPGAKAQVRRPGTAPCVADAERACVLLLDSVFAQPLHSNSPDVRREVARCRSRFLHTI